MTKLRDDALHIHRQHQGKLAIQSKVVVQDEEDLSLVYSPGVAEPSLEIYKEPTKVYDYTMKGNMVGVVTDGSAVLGLGDIGAKAALPVMEGKSVLFKSFAGVDSFPISLKTNDVEEIIQTVKLLEPTFGGINLEDIAAPNCFVIEERLKQEMNIPVFHDDQHGTAIVAVAGLINSLKLVNKTFATIKVVVNGAGAAGIAIIKLLQSFGVKNIILSDSQGAIYKGRQKGMNEIKHEMAETTNLKRQQGSLEQIIKDTDVFIGVSASNILSKEMIQSMNADPVIFAMANPDPEVLPDLAKQAGAKVIGTGRSDYPNQINNVLAFPGIFRGALDVRATQINDDMKIAAAKAIAELIHSDDLHEDYVIPGPFDARVAPAVASSVAQAAMDTGVAQLDVPAEEIARKTKLLSKLDD